MSGQDAEERRQVGRLAIERHLSLYQGKWSPGSTIEWEDHCVRAELEAGEPISRANLRRCVRRCSGFSKPGHRGRSCLLYTSDAADEEDSVDLGGRRIIKKKKKK